MHRLWIVTPPIHRLACVHLEILFSCVFFERIFRFHLQLLAQLTLAFAIWSNAAFVHLSWDIFSNIVWCVFQFVRNMIQQTCRKKKEKDLVNFHHRRLKCQMHNLRNTTRRSTASFGRHWFLASKKCLTASVGRCVVSSYEQVLAHACICMRHTRTHSAMCACVCAARMR